MCINTFSQDVSNEVQKCITTVISINPLATAVLGEFKAYRRNEIDSVQSKYHIPISCLNVPFSNNKPVDENGRTI